MYRDEDERLSDRVMGEAVMELLYEKIPITNARLLEKLQNFLLDADDAWREDAIRDAIRSVQTAVLDDDVRKKPLLHKEDWLDKLERELQEFERKWPGSRSWY